MPGKYNDSRLIHRIARECGLSVSGVYGILNGDAGFSTYHRTMVEELARAYGLSTTRPSFDAADITLGILIPKLPGYFWNEAMAGMKKAVSLYRKCGVRVKTVFRYFSPDLFEDVDRSLTEGFDRTPCDGYILYPLLRPRLWQFFRELPPAVPVVLFNDHPNVEEQKAFFAAREATAYVGADNVTEGEQAAAVMAPHLLRTGYLAALVIGPGDRLATGLSRICGFSSYMWTNLSQMQIEALPMEVAKKTSPALLASELERRLLAGRLDGVYVSAGFTHVAAAAIRKICRKHGVDELSIPCIGHEFSPSDQPYLLDGILRGYIRQDIYRQGQIAVEQIVEYLLHGTPMKEAVVPSSLYIKDGNLSNSPLHMQYVAERTGRLMTRKESPTERCRISLLPGGGYLISDRLMCTGRAADPLPPPPRSAQYMRQTTDPSQAAGYVTIFAPDGTVPTAYHIVWANADGPLPDLFPYECTASPDSPATVFSFPTGTLCPALADRLLIWSLRDSQASPVPAAAIIIGATRPRYASSPRSISKEKGNES